MLYPDIYNYDIISEAQRYYKLFWHYELSETDAKELLSKSTFQTLNNEANERLKKIDMDIYKGTKKERAKHEFDTALYFKIFIGILLAVTGVTCFHKIRNFFKKS